VANCLDCLLQRSNSRAALHVVRFRSFNAIVRSKYTARGPVIQTRVSQKAYCKWPRNLTQRASFASPHAERDVLSGVTRDREVNAFITGPAAFVGGVPLTRARNP
jgi:hypothetical protein